jgi:hypothetical protein
MSHRPRSFPSILVLEINRGFNILLLKLSMNFLKETTSYCHPFFIRVILPPANFSGNTILVDLKKGANLEGHKKFYVLNIV